MRGHVGKAQHLNDVCEGKINYNTTNFASRQKKHPLFTEVGYRLGVAKNYFLIKKILQKNALGAPQELRKRSKLAPEAIRTPRTAQGRPRSHFREYILYFDHCRGAAYVLFLET